MEFDRFIGIDWSGAKQLNTGSIAVASCGAGKVAPRLDFPPGERLWSRSKVAGFLAELADTNEKILAGIDCNFAYAEKIAKAQCGDEYSCFDLWRNVEEANIDLPNFYAENFWRHDDHKKFFWVEGKRLPGFEMPQRLTELACRVAGLGFPESPFKLIGPKQVGKGGLAGMRLLLWLMERLGERVAVWPFSSLQACEAASIVLVEIYPRLFLQHAGWGPAKVRTYEDLDKVLGALDSRGTGQHGPVSDHGSDALVSAAGLRFLAHHSLQAVVHPKIRREGWIFGLNPDMTML